jgi:CO dehydrogenase maturation factor
VSHTIALAGKGGTGKTTLASLIIKYLRKSGKTPVLAVDADANANLHEALGIEIGETIGHLREKTLDDIKNLPIGVTKDQYIEYKIHETLVEGEGFDLITMGRPEGPGCYCYANHLIRKYSEKIGLGYPYVVMDNEAGLEHLSRRTTNDVEHLLITSDPTQRGLRTVKRILDLCEELKLEIHKKGLVLNRTPMDLEIEQGEYHNTTAGNKEQQSSGNALKGMIDDLGIEWLGNIPYDSTIEEFDLLGKPLIELPIHCKAFKAAERIIAKLGI